MTWKRLGLNLSLEWIEEDPSGRRRVITPAGWILEEGLSLRFARMTSAEDAKAWASAMAEAQVYASYGSIDRAHEVWNARPGQPTPTGVLRAPPDALRLVERAMAARIWFSMSSNHTLPGLPDWVAAMRRKGPMGRPLGWDVGLYRRLPLQRQRALARLEDYCAQAVKAFESAPTQKAACITIDGVTQYSPWLSENFTGTLTQWAGPPPGPVAHDVWSEVYRPMSDPAAEPSGYVDPLLNQALLAARPDLDPHAIQTEVFAALPADAIRQNLSFDQTDAIWLARTALAKGKPFLLADETGYGKGRALASLALAALNDQFRVLFVTEKANLFSDFMRDAMAIVPSPLKPAIFHQDAKIIDANGQPMFKASSLKPSPDDRWRWTTYSQFNRADAPRTKEILSWMRAGPPVILLLDEVQNAAGQSNTAEAIALMTEAAGGRVMASSTFAKDEAQLEAFRDLSQLSDASWRRLKAAFGTDEALLRRAITIDWAERGVFIRRQHPPMSPPAPIWITPDAAAAAAAQGFSAWWQAMHALAKTWSAMTRSGTLWGRIGEPMARAIREFSMLQKLPALIALVHDEVAAGRKPVIVSDWNLSSHMARSVALGKVIDWKSGWAIAIDEMFPADELSKLDGPSVKLLHRLRAEALARLAALPDYGASPFDALRDALAASQIRMVEISGRTHHIDPDTGLPSARTPRARSLLILDFNEGAADVLLMTRAGNSGASLHAAATFSDRRQRHLIEWDISPDPVVRVQSWGRVRRKDQVSEPLRSTLLIDTPAERRRVARASAKNFRMQAHAGNADIRLDDQWLGPAARRAATSWLRANSAQGSLLGGHQADIEQVLARSVILDASDRERLMASLARAIDLDHEWLTSRAIDWDGPSRVIRRQWWWGKGDEALHWCERVWPQKNTATAAQVQAELAAHDAGKSLTAAAAIARWSQVWQDWFLRQPSAATAQRKAMLSWWLGAQSNFERATGVEITDPATGRRCRAIILGWDVPPLGDVELHNDMGIGLWVWLSTDTAPRRISLAALLARGIGHARPLGPASTGWFTGQPFATTALVLEGPSWSAAAWGSRNGPPGELLHILDTAGPQRWGWRMPARWSWADMQAHDRELPDADQAMAFLSAHKTAPVFWRKSQKLSITITGDAKELWVSGLNQDALDMLPFKMLRAVGSLQQNQDQSWKWRLPRASAKQLFYTLQASGSAPSVPATYAAWQAASFGRKA